MMSPSRPLDPRKCYLRQPQTQLTRPSTIGPPLTTLSFDTTASVSLLSALSSLISSESTAINPFTSYSFSPTATGASVTSGTDSGTPTATGPTTTQSVATTTPTSTSTSTNGAGHAVSPSGGVLVAIVVAVAALL